MIDSNEVIMYENGRDSGYLEGYEEGLLSKVEKLNPHPTEAIVLFYDSVNGMTLKDTKRTFEAVCNTFPDNKVIALPNTTSLESCSKDVLENFISMISEIIEQI